MADGGKAVFHVPQDMRRDDQTRNGEGQDTAPGPKGPPRGGLEDCQQNHPDDEIDHGVFAKDPEPERRTQHQDPSDAGPVCRLPQGQQSKGPTKQQRHIRGHDHGGEPHAREGREGRRHQEARAGIHHGAGQEEEGKAGRRVKQRRSRAHAGFRLPTDGRGAGNDPGQKRGFGEIAKGEVLRP